MKKRPFSSKTVLPLIVTDARGYSGRFRVGCHHFLDDPRAAARPSVPGQEVPVLWEAIAR